MPYVGRVPSAVPVTADDIPANSIDASKITDGSIELAEIADNSITDAKLNSSKLDGIETGATNYIHPTTHATADIADNAITEAKIADAAVVSLKSGRKNLIINGGFDVWQRGTSTTTSGFLADRWEIAVHAPATAVISKSSITDLIGFRDALQWTTGESDPYIVQKIEGTFLVGQVFTISFWMKGETPSTVRIFDYVGALFNQTPTPIETSGSWTRYANTFTVATTTPTSEFLSARIDLAENASNTQYITGVQLELGSVATDFEHRSYGEELALCHRYYQKSFLPGVTPTQGASTTSWATGIGLDGAAIFESKNSSDIAYFKFPVRMRTNPTMVRYGNSQGYAYCFSGGGFHVNSGGFTARADGFRFRQQRASVYAYVQVHWTADAEL